MGVKGVTLLHILTKIYISFLFLSRKNQIPEVIVMVTTITRVVRLINPVVSVKGRAIIRVHTEARVIHIGISAVPILLFCFVAPPINITKKINSKSNGVKEGTALTVSTKILSIPLVDVGTSYIGILIRITSFPSFPNISKSHIE